MTASLTCKRFVAAFGSQLLGLLSRSSVRQCLEFFVVTHPVDAGEPGTFVTREPSVVLVKKSVDV